MASLKTKPIINDSGSQEMGQLVHSYNHLLDTLGTLITGLKTAADAPAINALAVIAEASLEASVVKLNPQPNVPLAPGMKAV